MEKLLKLAIQKENFNHYHKTSGYIEKYLPHLSNSITKDNWKKNWIINQVYLKEIQKMANDFNQNNISVILLKGIYLIQTLYKDLGSRFMSDIDILVSEKQLEATNKVLLLNNYKLVEQEKWFADQFKHIYSKSIGNIEVTLEVHTRLYWDSSRFPDIKTLDQSTYFSLTDEENFVHLCAHYGFAHTFSKLYWLIDIYEIVKNNRNDLNWDLVKDIALSDSKMNSVTQVLYILDNFCELNLNEVIKEKFNLIKNQWWKKLFSEEQLTSDNHTNINFLCLKQFSKDNLKDAFKYNFGWAYNSVKSRLSSK